MKRTTGLGGTPAENLTEARKHRKHIGQHDYRQKLWLHRYLEILNATQAAIDVGYSKKTAPQCGHQLFVKYKDQIEKTIEKRCKRMEISADRLLQEAAFAALRNVGEAVCKKIRCPEDILQLPEHVQRSIEGWDYKANGEFVIKFTPKTPAQDLIGRYLKLFTTSMELTGKDGAPLIPLANNFNIDTSKLTQEQLDLLITMTGNKDPLAEIPMESTDEGDEE